MNNVISLSFDILWLNTILNFVKNDFEMILKLPEMPLRNVEYLHDLISERKNDISLELESLYESLWDAVKTYSIKFKFEVSVMKSEDAHTGNLIIEKVSNGTEQENDKLLEGTNIENVQSSTDSETDDDRSKFLKVLPFYEIIDNSINTGPESNANGSDNSSIDSFKNKTFVLEDTEEENTQTVNRDNSSDFNDQQSSDKNGNRSCKSVEETINKYTSEFSTDCSKNKISLKNRVIFEKSDDHLDKTEVPNYINGVILEKSDDHLDKTEVPNYIIEGIIDSKVMEKKNPWDSKLLQALSEPLESEKGLRLLTSAYGWLLSNGLLVNIPYRIWLKYRFSTVEWQAVFFVLLHTHTMVLELVYTTSRNLCASIGTCT